MSFIILNNQAIAAKDAAISVQDRGFRYGDGVFDAIRVHRGVPYRFEWHIARLKRGLAVIRIDCALNDLQEQCRQLLVMNNVQDGILRIQVTRGTGSRGYLPDVDAPPTLVIETLPLPSISHKPVSLWLSQLHRIPANSLPIIKSCQGLNSTLVRMEAQEHGCFDALQLNQSGHIAETSSANIFWVKNKTLYTPALSADVLGGSIRAALLALSPYPVKDIEEPIEMLKNAEAVFVTNVAWGVIPVKALEPLGYRFQSEAEASVFASELAEDIEHHSQLQAQAWQSA